MPALRKDYAGLRFGKLVAMKDVGGNDGRRLWLCKCDCGSTTTLISRELSKVGSCGCSQGGSLDITGVRSGKLVALKCIGSRAGAKSWLCKCDCGNNKILPAGRFKFYNSCGCLRGKPEFLTYPAKLYLCETDQFIGYGITTNVSLRMEVHSRALRAAGVTLRSATYCNFRSMRAAYKVESLIKREFPKPVATSCNIPGFKRESISKKQKAKLLALLGDRKLRSLEVAVHG